MKKDSGRTLHPQGGYNIMNIRLKELEDKISKSTNDVEVLALKKRIKKAQMLRSWRRNAYSLFIETGTGTGH